MDNSYTFTTSLGSLATNSYDYLNQFFANPNVILILFIVFLTYFLIFSSLGEQDNTAQTALSQNSDFLMVVIITIFGVLLLLNGFQYFFGIDIVATIKNIFTKTPEIDVTIDTTRLKQEIKDQTSSTTSSEFVLKPEVFNIPENMHTYNDAKALCKAFDARLATYKEVEDAYKNGAEWCNYGWSEDQMALFPTQKETWDKLQTIKGHENDCGRPGVNGGHIANPNVKFGVNCYGMRPKISPIEQDLMANVPKYPKTKEDIEEENRVDYWKKRLSEIIVSPFNYTNWSRI
jgi:hypothetical protein